MIEYVKRATAPTVKRDEVDEAMEEGKRLKMKVERGLEV